MNGHKRDVIRRTSAVAHADQPGGDKKLSRRWSNSRRTQARWRDDGPPAMRNAQEYLLTCPNPMRAMATIRTSEIQARLQEKSTTELIERYREVISEDKRAEAEDTNHDLCSSTPWLDRAISSERDAALDIEKAAIERIFASRRVSLERVRGD